MNILFITHAIDPTLGGVSRVTMTLAKELSMRGNTCSFIYWEGVTRNHLCISPDKNKAAFISQAIEYTRKKKVDIIINQDNYHSAIVSFLKKAKADGVRVVNVLHIEPSFIFQINHKGIKTKTKNLWYKVVYGMGILVKQRRDMVDLADRFVLLSPSYIESFMRIYRVNTREKLCAIQNPVPLDYYETSFENKKKDVLIVSRLENNPKRITTALRIWQQTEKSFPEWCLVLAGYGNDTTKILDYAKNLNLRRFHFVGRVNDPRPLYAQASIFMMTSAYEGFPMTLLEAMQFGCVPIAFDAFSSIHDLIKDGENGLLVENGSEEDFVNKLSRILSDKKLRKRMSEKTEDARRHFSIQNITDQWEQTLKELTTDGKESKNESDNIIPNI